MDKIDYVITTSVGAIPYIIDTEKVYLNKLKKVFIDDILYKDSFYDKGNKHSLKAFIGSTTDVILGFKAKPGILTSKRGNYKINAEKYSQIVQDLEVKNFSDFKTGILKIQEREVIEPKDLSEFKSMQERKDVIFGTLFINELTEKGMMIFIDDNNDLQVRHINDSECEYEKYMFSINEMNAFTFISENNYRILNDYFSIKSSSSYF